MEDRVVEASGGAKVVDNGATKGSGAIISGVTRATGINRQVMG